jgi:hypothetical protein
MAIKGKPFSFSVCLFSRATGDVLPFPTLDAADFEISTDAGAFTSLTTTPTVNPAFGGLVQFNLTASEVGNQKFSVKMIDVSNDQWETQYYHETVIELSGGGGSTVGSVCVIDARLTATDSEIITANIVND